MEKYFRHVREQFTSPETIMDIPKERSFGRLPASGLLQFYDSAM